MFPSREQQKSSEMGVLGYFWWDRTLTAAGLEGSWAVGTPLFTGSPLAPDSTAAVVDHLKQPQDQCTDHCALSTETWGETEREPLSREAVTSSKERHKHVWSEGWKIRVVCSIFTNAYMLENMYTWYIWSISA